MSRVEERLRSLGFVLPGEVKVPQGQSRPFAFVNIRGDRAFVSGHGPRESDGSVARPLGQVGGEVSLDDARLLARKSALAMLSSLRREIGDLDRITGWCRVFGMVNSAPGFDRQTEVINGFSETIVDAFGPDIGRHARSAVGMSGLPLGFAVEVEAEVMIAP
jgi:enamine deaminase RidA (YjgF/YER057c/UK114 family)